MKRAKILGVTSTLLYVASIITALALELDAEIVVLIVTSLLWVPLGILAIWGVLYIIGYLFVGMWMAILGVDGDPIDTK